MAQRCPQRSPHEASPSLRIGGFPAFYADTGLSQGKVPCVVRILLAGDDYVLAEWCAMDAGSHAAEFERILSTYVPSPAHFNPPALPGRHLRSRAQTSRWHTGMKPRRGVVYWRQGLRPAQTVDGPRSAAPRYAVIAARPITISSNALNWSTAGTPNSGDYHTSPATPPVTSTITRMARYIPALSVTYLLAAMPTLMTRARARACLRRSPVICWFFRMSSIQLTVGHLV